MAKIPVGVGPKLPQIVVLFGATGDLAHKKLLPGLFHLVNAGFISKCRIIGVSLDALDAEGFRALARDAVFEQHAHHPKKESWPAFEAMLDYVPIAAGAGALKEAVDKAEKSFAEEAPARPLSERAAERRPVGDQDAERGPARRRIARHHGKAVRHRSRERGRAQ